MRRQRRPSLAYRLLDAQDQVRRSRGRRIGILGGSFNPPHEGHLHLTAQALQRLALDEVWWLLTPQNPLKTRQDSSALDQRRQLCERLVQNPRVRVTALEAALGSNLTVVSLDRILALFGDRRFYWLMGADNLATFHRWHGWRGIAALLPMAVIDRPGYGLKALRAAAARKLCNQRRFGRLYDQGWRFITGPRDPQSSSALRQQGLTVSHLISRSPRARLTPAGFTTR